MGKKEKVVEQPKDKFDGLSLDLKDIKSAVLNLASEEVEVLTTTCSACFNFVIKDREQNGNILLDMGAIEHLVALIASPDALIRRHSLMVLGLMSGIDSVRQVLAQDKQSIVASCTNLIQEDDAIVVEFAMAVLANLVAGSYSIKDEIAEQQSLPLIIKQLASADPDTKKHALVCLLSLAADFEVRGMIGELDAVVAAIGLITSEYPVIQQLALNLCSVLCHEPNAVEQLVGADGLEKLTLFVENNEFIDIHTHALETLAQCLVNDGVFTQFHESGQMTRLIQAIKTNIDQGQTPYAEEAGIYFSDFIYHLNKSLKVLVENGAADVIGRMLGSASDEAKISACKSTRVLAKEAAFRDIAADFGITRRIIELLQNENIAIRREAVLSLSLLIKNHETNLGLALSNRVTSHAIRLMGDMADHDLICGTLSVMVTLAKDEHAIREGHECGLIERLVAIAEQYCDSPSIQNRLLDVVTTYFVTDDDRKRIIDSALIEIVIELLLAPDRPVRQAACSAIMIIARSEQAAGALVSKGVLDALCRVQQSSHLKSNLADCTLQQVLTCNLSAKYALKRKLNQTDKIKDGFYDSGLLHAQAKFDSLSHHRQVDINDKQAVLLVNLPDNSLDSSKNIEAKNLHILRSNYSSSNMKNEPKSDRRNKKKREESLMIPNGANSTLRPLSKENSGQDGTRGLSVSRTQSKSAMLNDDNIETSKSPDPQVNVAVIKPVDMAILKHIDRAVNQLNNDQTVEEQLTIIADIVANAFGGPILKSELIEFGYEMAIVELKRASNSNVVPLGQIAKGLYRERALLFKVICDQVGLPVTLEQREYRRAWNAICLHGKHFIVDLMDSPGKLHAIDNPSATDYITV